MTTTLFPSEGAAELGLGMTRKKGAGGAGVGVFDRMSEREREREILEGEKEDIGGEDRASRRIICTVRPPLWMIRKVW